MLRRKFLTILASLLLGLYSTITISLAETRVFTDAAGRKIELPSTINRVMAAGPPASVLLYAIAPEKMVGWVRELSDADKEFIAEPYRDLPVHGRLTGRGNTANLEAVLALKPDIIIDAGTVDATYASLADRVREQTGIPYVLIDGSFEKSAETIRQVGELLGKQENAGMLADYAEKAISQLDAAITAIPSDQRPRVYYGRGPDGLETGLAGSINMEVLDAVGAMNVANAAGSGGLANVSLEQVLSWNPDVILTLDRNFQQNVLQDPAWSGISAVKNRKVYQAPTNPFGWFDTPPGINRLISVSWLANILYPDRISEDLSSEVRQFYKLFYHVDISDDQVKNLLSDAMAKP